MAPIYFPQKAKEKQENIKFENFLDVLKKLQVSIMFIMRYYKFQATQSFWKNMLNK